MPKRVSILLAGLALGLAFVGCGGGNGGSVPTAAPSITPGSPNPKISSAVIEVTKLGTPVPNVAVQISTPRSSANPRPGTAFLTQYTKGNGQSKFSHLKPSQTYCWVALLGPAGQTSSLCAPWYEWQGGTVTLGT